MVAAPYDAPTYYAPSYFYFANLSVSIPPGTTPYNAPTYFPPSYFYGGMTLPVVTPPSVPTGRDGAAYSALLSMLAASGAFQEVIFGGPTQRNQAGSDSYPLVVVTPKGWEEADEYDPALILRRVSFVLTIVVQSQDGSSQFDQLDQLSSVVKSVIDRSDLGGNCLAALTRIRAGHYVCSAHYPEQSVELEGEFSSLIDPYANNSALS